ncbi:MAG: nucleotidyl transferase AbiEii/AbiGii toxin family protein [Chloroflexi bacterium]|nr:nucleotidyl transferase AbiEii/AbiGii toxin family protein [Chloroflexota bacterium]
MRVSPEKLALEAEATGFQPDVLEKVVQLLGLLDAIRSHPFLMGKLALKGGTALNLFVFDVPRLSVDIDLNYGGAEATEAMLDERPRVEEAIQAVFSREDLGIRRIPGEHAGGKWSLRYPAASGQSGRIDVDINYMYRVPLWPVTTMDSRPVGNWRATGIPVVDKHELAAGKLAALLTRRRARDLFDSSLIFSIDGLDVTKLRTAFVVYGAGVRRDWRTVSIEDAAFDPEELFSQLVPALRSGGMQRADAAAYGYDLVHKCRRVLSELLPFSDREQAFLDLLLDAGEVDAELLTTDPELRYRIQAQPLLEWKAQNVRRHRGISSGRVDGDHTE